MKFPENSYSRMRRDVGGLVQFRVAKFSRTYQVRSRVKVPGSQWHIPTRPFLNYPRGTLQLGVIVELLYFPLQTQIGPYENLSGISRSKHQLFILVYSTLQMFIRSSTAFQLILRCGQTEREILQYIQNTTIKVLFFMIYVNSRAGTESLQDFSQSPTVTFSNVSHDCRDGLRRVQISSRKFLGTDTSYPLTQKGQISKKGTMNTLQLKSVTINASTYLLNTLRTGTDNNVS